MPLRGDLRISLGERLSRFRSAEVDRPLSVSAGSASVTACAAVYTGFPLIAAHRALPPRLATALKCHLRRS
jgi:hypothetical protein